MTSDSRTTPRGNPSHEGAADLAASPPVALRGRTPRATPRTTALVIGRDDELRRLERALTQVPVAVICGVPGVGKSTLALHHASRSTTQVAYVKLSRGATIAELADAVQRQLAASQYEVSLDDGERLHDAWTVVERMRCLVVLDDVHVLPPEARELVVDSALQTLQHGRLIATSRELIPIAAGKPDRLQLRLEALDRSSAELLWRRFIELYGPARDFETAWLRSRGNPFLLRQAHIGTLAEGNPLEPVVRAFSADERRLANALAVSNTPLPAQVLHRLLPEPRAERALRTLVTGLIFEVMTDDRYWMHDLWRESVNSELTPEAHRAIAADLVVALDGCELDAPTRVQEAARHLAYLDRRADIGPLLLGNSTEMVRQGAAGALLRELDDLPPTALTPELLMVRARTLARNLQLRRAYQELRRLIEKGGLPPEAQLLLASFATIAGELAHAEQIIEALLADRWLDPRLRERARLALGWNHANQGRMDEVRALLDELESEATRPPPRVVALRIFVLALELPDERWADLGGDPLGWLRGRPGDLWSRILTPVVAGAILAHYGRFDEADEVSRWLEHNIHAHVESVELRFTKMAIRLERGERSEPLAYFRGAQRVLDRGGHFPGAIWSRSYTCRLLFLLGRRREALAELAAARAEIVGRGALGFTRVVESAALEDPLGPGWLEREIRVQPGKAGDAARGAVRSVLRMACAGGPAVADRQLPRVEVPPGPDYAFERALLEIASAVLARRHGQERVAAQHLRRAVAHAAECGADDGLPTELYEALIAASAAPATDATGGHDALVIDGRRHEIRFGGHRLALAGRSASRQLLYALAGAPRCHLTLDLIARTLWNTDYDPLRHASTVKSSIRRLRSLLAGTTIEVQSDSRGYRLVSSSELTFIPPVEP